MVTSRKTLIYLLKIAHSYVNLLRFHLPYCLNSIHTRRKNLFKGKLLIFLYCFIDKSYISKGNEYYLRLQFDMAEEQYRKALEIEPGNAEARYNLANTLMQQKKYKAAIEEYDAIEFLQRTAMRKFSVYSFS